MQQGLRPSIIWHGRSTTVTCGRSWLHICRNSEIEPCQPLRLRGQKVLNEFATKLHACWQPFLAKKVAISKAEGVCRPRVIISHWSGENELFYLNAGEDCCFMLEADILFDLQRWLAFIAGGPIAGMDDDEAVLEALVDDGATAVITLRDRAANSATFHINAQRFVNLLTAALAACADSDGGALHARHSFEGFFLGMYHEADGRYQILYRPVTMSAGGESFYLRRATLARLAIVIDKTVNELEGGTECA